MISDDLPISSKRSVRLPLEISLRKILFVALVFGGLIFYYFFSNKENLNMKNDQQNEDYKIFFSNFSINDLKLFYFNLVTNPDKRCPKFELFGNKNKDGGYEVCVEGPLRADPQNCHVMSFGVNKDWSFDDAMLKYGCSVDSYDPSIHLEDHERAPGHKFHNLGLGKRNEFWEEKKWKMVNIRGAIMEAQLENKVIDVIKCDAEGAEWPFLEDLMNEELPVKQVILEIHSPKRNPHQVTREDMSFINELFLKLKDSGFVVSHSYHKYWCCTAFAPFFPKGKTEKCCYEVYIYNKKYL